MKRNFSVILSISIIIGSVILLYSVDNQTINTQAGHKQITLFIEKGDAWTHWFKIMPLIGFNTTPQIAVWLSDTDGNFIKTLYLTSKQKKIRRSEALPVWSFQQMNAPENVLLVTSATPKGSLKLDSDLEPGNKTCFLNVELNLSMDYNEFYPKNAVKGSPNYSGTSGQPSLIYQTKIESNAAPGYTELKLVGHGSPEGSSGKISPDTTTLTTALNMVKKISITLK